MSVLTRRVGGYSAKTTAHCAEITAKNSMPNTYDPSLKEPPSEFLQRLFDAGFAHEEKVFSLIVDASPAGTVALLVETKDEDGQRTDEGRAQLERETFAALSDAKVNVILGGRLGPLFESLLAEYRGENVSEYDPGRISQPDVLVISARDGNGFPTGILPVDVKDHKVFGAKTKPKVRSFSPLNDLTARDSKPMEGSYKSDDFMQLAHYFRHLESMGLAGEAEGAIIGRELLAFWGRLDEPLFGFSDGSRAKASALEVYDHWTAVTNDVVANAVARDNGEQVAASVGPQWSSFCGECEWRTVCDEELSTNYPGGHITLLPGITPLRAKAHYGSGITSVRGLARLNYADAQIFAENGDISGVSPAVAAYAGSGVRNLPASILQARASVAGRVARSPGVDVVDLFRADVEVDFDLENSDGPVREHADGEHPGGPLVYLWGTRTVTRRVKRGGEMVTTVKPKQFSDFSDTAYGECEAFAGFWDFMVSSRKAAHTAGKTWRAYHYTAHELGWIRKLAARYAGTDGIPTLDEVDDFLGSGDVVDLYAVLSTQLIWPTRTHSIKDLAKWSRFSWRASDAGGDNSMLWFVKAANGRTIAERKDFTRKVLHYNIDDVAAQHHLRDWITSLEHSENPGSRIPSAEKLRAPRI
jgi:predicted RecB family nuclease